MLMNIGKLKTVFGSMLNERHRQRRGEDIDESPAHFTAKEIKKS
jgi:hypothetical protein